MGKSLIIKGADFSSVSIGAPVIPEQPNTITQANLTEAYAFYTKSHDSSSGAYRLYFIMDISQDCIVSVKNTSSVIRSSIQLRPYTADYLKQVLGNGTPTSPAVTGTNLPQTVYDSLWLWSEGGKTADTVSVNDYPDTKSVVIVAATPTDSTSFPSISDVLNNLEVSVTGATQIIR